HCAVHGKASGRKRQLPLRLRVRRPARKPTGCDAEGMAAAVAPCARPPSPALCLATSPTCPARERAGTGACMKLSRHTLSLALALALPGIAAAEQAPTQLDDVIVTATRTPIPIEDSVVPVQVIDRVQIERSQASSLQALLRGRAGLDFTNQGGAGKITSLFLRGSNSNQVLVLVDGVRIGSATNGMPTLQDLPVDQVERVEIVRGPRSSLYGSEAIGGVIQIFTRSAGPGLQQNLSLTAGSNNLRQASAGFSNRGERGWVSAQSSQER